MAVYTCFSDEFLGCGSIHKDKAKATTCCKIAARQFNEKREPVLCEHAANAHTFQVAQSAKERKGKWLAQQRAVGTRRRNYELSGVSALSTIEQDLMGTEPPQTTTTTTVAPGSVGVTSEIAAAPGAATDALSGLAAAIAPLVAPLVASSALSQDELKNLAEGTAEGARMIAMQVIEERLRGVDAHAIKLAAEDAEERVSKAIEKLDEHRTLAVAVNGAKAKKINGSVHPKLEILIRTVAAGDNAFLSGPAGSGKTTAARQVADALGMELFIQPVALDKFEATGFIDAGGTYRESAVYLWAKSKKPALLLIDEVDGWLAQALVALNPILDNCIGIFPGGQQFDINPSSRIIATGNTWGMGADAEYCGRNRLDAASLDRLGARIMWGYDESFERTICIEKYGGACVDGKAKKIPKAAGVQIIKHTVKLSQDIRTKIESAGTKILWGPRQTLGLCRRVAAGMSIAEALDLSALTQLPTERRANVLSGLKLG